MSMFGMGIRTYDGIGQSDLWSGDRGYDGLAQSNLWSGSRAYDGLGRTIIHPGRKNRGYDGLGQEPDVAGTIITSLITAGIAGLVGGLIFSLSTRIFPVKTVS